MKGKLMMNFTLALILIGLFSGSALANNSTLTIAWSASVKSLDPATETTLQGLSENNLAKYTQYGNAEFKAALTQGVLDKTATQISSQLGTYESKTFLRTEDQQGYIIVHYKAKYSKGEAGIRMVFDKDHLVAGQWFEQLQISHVCF